MRQMPKFYNSWKKELMEKAKETAKTEGVEITEKDVAIANLLLDTIRDAYRWHGVNDYWQMFNREVLG